MKAGSSTTRSARTGMPLLVRALRPRSRRSQRGFTIIEMVVASILLAVGVTAALYTISLSTHNTAIASEYSVASMLAQQRIAEMEAQPDQISGGSQNGSFGDEYSQYSWDQTVETTDFSTLMRVTLTISWQSGAAPRSIQFVTYEPNAISTAATTALTNAANGTTTGTGTGTGAGG